MKATLVPPDIIRSIMCSVSLVFPQTELRVAALSTPILHPIITINPLLSSPPSETLIHQPQPGSSPHTTRL